MGRKANPKLIGAFVLGAIILIVGGTLTFATGRFFDEKTTITAFFEGTVKGLNVGAPVNFRGARVGTVTDIAVIVRSTDEIEIPVTLQLESGRVQNMAGFTLPPVEALSQMIGAGMRAQLVSQSLVTGQLNIALDFHPETEARFRSQDPEALEMPTIPSALEEVTRVAGEVAEDLPELVAKGITLLEEITGQLETNQEKISRSMSNVESFTNTLAGQEKNIDLVMTDAAATMANLRTTTDRLPDLMDRGESTLAGLDAAIADMRAIVSENRQSVGQALVSIEDAAQTLDEILAENRQAINDFANITLFDVSGLITDTQQLVNTLNRVGEDLERDPARFLFGDQQQGFQGGQ